MKEDSSKAWRSQGDYRAFDPGTWEFGSRQFVSSARQLMSHFSEKQATPDFDSIMSLATAQFLVSLSLELLCKALFLKAGCEPKDKVYTHKVATLLPTGLLNEEQLQLLKFAERYVIWAGRYPTPKWTQEQNREEYDVPSVFIDGHEHIDARDLPNSASVDTISALFTLYEHIHAAWSASGDAQPPMSTVE